MQRMASFIQRAIYLNGIITIFYLDDVLVICQENQDPEWCFSRVIATIRKLGLPIAWEKVVAPTKCTRFLGIDIDVGAHEIRIPDDKIHKFIDIIQKIKHKSHLTKRELQSLIGHINHLGKAVVPARRFMNRLLHVLRESTRITIRASEWMKRDIDWFDAFLSQYNGRSMIVCDLPCATIEADSCLSGGGARFNDLCYAFVYPVALAQNMHISQLESYNCMIAVRVFLHDQSNACFRVLCDNEATVMCMNSGRGRDPIIMATCRAVWFFAARRGLRIVFEHAPGDSMYVADTLSRQHLGAVEEEKASIMVEAMRLRYVDVSPICCDYEEFI